MGKVEGGGGQSSAAAFRGEMYRMKIIRTACKIYLNSQKAVPIHFLHAVLIFACKPDLITYKIHKTFESFRFLLIKNADTLISYPI